VEIAPSEHAPDNQEPPRNLPMALLRLLPNDHYGLLTLIGTLAGIGYYIATHDSWLLVTFLGILFGGAVEHSRNRGKPRK
jgi:hypothetical protein